MSVAPSHVPVSLKALILTLFLILLAGAVIFVQERMLFCDAPFMIFTILNTDALCINEYRYGCFITQGVPLLGGRMGLPLDWILFLYSVSFNLFYLGVAALLLFRFRNLPLAVLMALYYTLFAGHTYFWTNNEIHQAIAWMFLFFGLVQYRPKQAAGRIWRVPLLLACGFLAVFTHPLVLFVLPFLWVFFMLEGKIGSRRETLLISLFLALVCAAKYYLMKSGWYDGEKIGRVTGISLKDLPSVFRSPQAALAAGNLIRVYYFVPLLFVWGGIAAWRAGKYRQLGLTVFFTLGYFAAVCLTFESFLPFYHESEWMPYAIITATLFVYYVLPDLRVRTGFAVLAVIFLVRLVYIGDAARHFTARKNWIYQVLDRMSEQGQAKGYLLASPEADNPVLQMSWGLPVESLIASSLRGDRPGRSFVMDTREGMSKRMVYKGTEFISCFKTEPAAALNTRYFSIDTSALYVPVTGIRLP